MITVEPDALRVLDAPPRCMHSTLVPLPESKGMDHDAMPMLAASADGRTMAIARGAQVVLWRPEPEYASGRGQAAARERPPPAPAGKSPAWRGQPTRPVRAPSGGRSRSLPKVTGSIF